MVESSVAHSGPDLKFWFTLIEKAVHTGSDVLVGCSTGVITEGLEDALLLHTS